MKTYIISAILIVLFGNNAFSQCKNIDIQPDTMGFEPYQWSDFLTWKVDSDGQDTNWNPVKSNANNGDFSILITDYNEDWLLTSCYDLSANKYYDLSFYIKSSDNLTPNQNIKVLIGTGQNQDTLNFYDTLILNNEIYHFYSYSKLSKVFNVSSTGSYFIGFYVYGECIPFQSEVYIDDILLVEHLCEPKTISLGNDTTICKGDTLRLQIDTSYTSYLWSDSANKYYTDITTTGNYFVNAKDEFGCEFKSDTISITAYELPDDTLLITGDTSFCMGDSVSFQIQLSNARCEDYNILWSNYATDSIITVFTNGSYVYQISDTVYGCSVVSDSVSVDVTYPYEDQEICIVTVDENGKNKIIWEKESGKFIKSYNIYSETYQDDSFALIGNVAFSELSTFIDSNSNPAKKPYAYKISCIDSCDNESDMSDLHQTIHLTISTGPSGENNLLWSYYYGFDYSTFRIYRDTSGSFELLDSIQLAVNSYTDINPPSGDVYYQVEVQKPSACNPTRSGYNSSKSNIVNSKTSTKGSLIKDRLRSSFFPNPSDGIIYINTTYTKDKKIEIMIYDINGKLVYNSTLNKIETGGILPVSLSSLEKGLYVIKLLSKDFYYTEKLVIE